MKCLDLKKKNEMAVQKPFRDLQDLYQIAVDLGFYHLVLIIVDLTSSTQDLEAGSTKTGAGESLHPEQSTHCSDIPHLWVDLAVMLHWKNFL